MNKDFISEFNNNLLLSSWITCYILFINIIIDNENFFTIRERIMIFMILFIPLFVFSNFFGGRR